MISPRAEAASAGCRPWSFPRPRERRILVLTNSMGQLHGNDQKYMYHAVSQAYLRDAETVTRRANHTISSSYLAGTRSCVENDFVTTFSMEIVDILREHLNI